MRTTSYPEAEKAILGCVLQDSACAADLNPEWFHDLRLREVAVALQAMNAARKPIDLATTAHEMRGTEGIMPLLAECQDACHSPANWPYWREELVEALTLRSILRTAQKAIYEAEHGESGPGEMLDQFERDALAIRQQLSNDGEEKTLGTALGELITAYESGASRGLMTGFRDLDRILGGLKPQQLVILAARPSVGKTALALNIADHLAGQGVPVGFFSLEMASRELAERLMCARARIDSSAFRSGSPNQRELQAFVGTAAALSKAPLYISDKGGLTMAQLASRARRMVQRHGIKLLAVDYLGLLRSGEKSRNRYEETSLISQGLKALAKELNLPVLALAQLNRDSEREDREPRLSDLRDSGSIEQDADIVALLHRGRPMACDPQPVRLIVAKHRAGRTGIVDLVFGREFTLFENAPLGEMPQECRAA